MQDGEGVLACTVPCRADVCWVAQDPGQVTLQHRPSESPCTWDKGPAMSTSVPPNVRAMRYLTLRQGHCPLSP